MNRIFVSLLIGMIATSFLGCNNGKTQDVMAARPSALPLEIFVFIDKSTSVSYTDSKVYQKANTAFVNALNLVQNPGDKVSLFYLHGNTGGASAAYSFVVPPFNYPPNANTIQRNTYKKNYDYTLNQQRVKALEAFRQTISENNHSVTKNATDILGTLEVLSRNTDANHQKYLLLLTDGIQTSGGFSVNPTDIPGAGMAASETLRKIGSKYAIQRDALSGTKAYMVLPFDALSSSHNKYLDTYWQRVFQAYQVALTCY